MPSPASGAADTNGGHGDEGTTAAGSQGDKPGGDVVTGNIERGDLAQQDVEQGEPCMVRAVHQSHVTAQVKMRGTTSVPTQAAATPDRLTAMLSGNASPDDANSAMEYMKRSLDNCASEMSSILLLVVCTLLYETRKGAGKFNQRYTTAMTRLIGGLTKQQKDTLCRIIHSDEDRTGTAEPSTKTLLND